MLQISGNFLEPESAQKMRETSKQWSDVKIYENIFPKESEVAVFKNLNTEEIMWETIKFTESWETMPKQDELGNKWNKYMGQTISKCLKNFVHWVSYLCQNDSAKWKNVFVWFADNRYELKNNEVQNDALLKKLVLEIAANVDVTL